MTGFQRSCRCIRIGVTEQDVHLTKPSIRTSVASIQAHQHQRKTVRRVLLPWRELIVRRTWGVIMKTLFNRMIGASRLDPLTYERVEGHHPDTAGHMATAHHVIDSKS